MPPPRLGLVWRQMRVDGPYLARVRRAMYFYLLRANAVALIFFALLTVGVVAFAASDGDWTWALLALVMLAAIPLTLWRAATLQVRRLPAGTYVAYAVTPDGTFHVSNAGGTTTVNPGFVAKLAATADCWLVALYSGLVLPVPRELLPESDARLLVRHLPGRPLPAARAS